MSHSPLLKGRSIIPHICIEHPCTVKKKEWLFTGTAYVSMLHLDCKHMHLFSINECFRQVFRRHISYRQCFESGSDSNRLVDPYMDPDQKCK